MKCRCMSYENIDMQLSSSVSQSILANPKEKEMTLGCLNRELAKRLFCGCFHFHSLYLVRVADLNIWLTCLLRHADNCQLPWNKINWSPLMLLVKSASSWIKVKQFSHQFCSANISSKRSMTKKKKKAICYYHIAAWPKVKIYTIFQQVILCFRKELAFQSF